MLLRTLLMMLALSAPDNGATGTVTFRYVAVPGNRQETVFLADPQSSTVVDGARRLEPGQSGTYRFPAPAQSACTVELDTQGTPEVSVTTSAGKPLQATTAVNGAHWTIEMHTPASLPTDSQVCVRIQAKRDQVTIRHLQFRAVANDRNNNGIPDTVEESLGVSGAKAPQALPRPSRPTTCFETAEPWRPDIAVPADQVLLARTDQETVESWLGQGYRVVTAGSCAANQTYGRGNSAKASSDEGTDTSTSPDESELVPTQKMVETTSKHFSAGIEAGSSGACLTDLESSSHSGYSQAFQALWQAQYDTVWRDPSDNVTSRHRAERLKAGVILRMVDGILSDVKKKDAGAARIVALRGPVSCFLSSTVSPIRAIADMSDVQEVIGKVGPEATRTPVRAGGVRTERPFETATTEFSAFQQLLRGSGKRLWYRVDPFDDTSGISDSSQQSCAAVLAAALMCQDVDSFETVPWPEHVYGKVPKTYASVLNTVTGMLADAWRSPGGAVTSGTSTIGTFVADSMLWQRGEPSPSNPDGFTALTLPFILHGMPLRVLSLERASEPGYLDVVKTLVVSYDFLKPTDAEQNRAIATWVKRGGVLLVLGGRGPYDDVADSWWRQAGSASPLDDLLTSLDVRAGAPDLRTPPAVSEEGGRTLLEWSSSNDGKSSYTSKTIDLTQLAHTNGNVTVRFRGERLRVGSAVLRIGGRLALSFRAGSELETRFLLEDHGSYVDNDGRHANLGSWWEYRFDNLPQNQAIALTVEVGNSAVITGRPSEDLGPTLEAMAPGFDRTLMRVRVPGTVSMAIYPAPSGATTLYRAVDGGAPVIWRAPAGSGTVVYSALPPAFFTRTAQKTRMLRAIARLTVKAAGGEYNEAHAFIARRGTYTVVHALGKEQALEGHYVDLLDPKLSVVEDPEVPAHSTGIYAAYKETHGGPRILAVSGRLRARLEGSTTTAMLVQAPGNTDGMVRLWRAGHTLLAAKGCTVMGIPVSVTTEMAGGTALVRYPNDAQGVLLRLSWR